MDTNLITQILWGRTTHVGCGWTQFPLQDGASRFRGIFAEGEYENFFVCNYGVGGNVPGEFTTKMLLESKQLATLAIKKSFFLIKLCSLFILIKSLSLM